ncbi:glycosyltransferase [Flavobacterium sp. JLP]|uniref:glycosyltransferase family 2 protein n=1 Tax=Flavobacterium sp. JLP TaxID=2783793 RepID=UPI00188A481D|nr:glycosyltransferase [Flavobacterium sp. JLP]MBF4507141.1 glycosyltransferase [Flavobacterium sp. JLP]
MNLSPLVSIIVPNYNHSAFLVQRLESVFNQTFQDFEVILLDDKSTDDSLVILRKYADHPKVSCCIFNEINTGNTFKQWEKGISLAKGELIWIAESDDFCELNFLEELVKPFLDDKEVVLSYCQSNKVDGNNNVTGNWITHTQSLDSQNFFLKNFTMQGNSFIAKYLINRNVIPNAGAVVFKKTAIKDDSYLTINPEFRYCGDWMFYFKLITNFKIAFTAKSLNNFRYHSSSVIANAIKTENRIRIIDIDFNMRKVLMQFIKQNDISIVAYNEIKKHNNNVIRYLKYEKGLLLIKSSNKLKGYLLIITVFGVCWEKYNIRKKIRMKIRNLLK